MDSSHKLEQLEKEIHTLKQEIKALQLQVDIYQTASQQVVNLAFSLIVGATIAIVVKAVL